MGLLVGGSIKKEGLSVGGVNKEWIPQWVGLTIDGIIIGCSY